MRIDQISRINQVYNTNSSSKVKSTAKAGSQDSLAISQIGRDMQVAKKAVANVNDIRMDRVEDVKAKLANHEYEKNFDQIMNELLNRYSN